MLIVICFAILFGHCCKWLSRNNDSCIYLNEKISVIIRIICTRDVCCNFEIGKTKRNSNLYDMLHQGQTPFDQKITLQLIFLYDRI